MPDEPIDPQLAAEEAARKKLEAENELQFSDPIGDVIEDLEEAAAAEILEEQRELLDSIEEKKRRAAQLEEDRRTEPERERKYQVDLSWRRLAAGIALFAALGYGCTQIVGNDDETVLDDGGSGTGGEKTGDDTETAADPTDSRPPLQCAVGAAGPDAALTSQLEAEISGAADQTHVDAELASTASAAAYEVGSHIFTLTVFGDGESVAVAPTTQWYNPRFIVNNDASTNTYEPGGFAVDVGWWGDAKNLQAVVLDENFVQVPSSETSVDVEWLDPSTLQVTAVIDGPQLEVTNMRVEMSVRLQNADGNTTATFNNDACWTAS